MSREETKGDVPETDQDSPRIALSRARQLSRAVKYLAEEWMDDSLESAYIMAAGIHANWMMRYAEGITGSVAWEKTGSSGTVEERLAEYTETMKMVQNAKKSKARAERNFSQEHRDIFDGIRDGKVLPSQRDKNLYRALLFWIGACASVHSDLVMIKGAAGEFTEYPSRKKLCEKIIEEAAERAEWDFWNAEILPIPGPPYMNDENTVTELMTRAKKSRDEARALAEIMKQIMEAAGT